MSPQHRSLNELMTQARARLRARHLFRGAALTLAAIGATIIASAFAADALSQKTGLIVALRFLPIVIGIFAGLLFIARPLRAKIPDERIARLIEERCVLSDRLVTAVEYSKDSRDASPDIVNRLVEDTGERCSKVDPDVIID